jgi:tetratricopeptide (TPR) repeat protein
MEVVYAFIMISILSQPKAMGSSADLVKKIVAASNPKNSLKENWEKLQALYPEMENAAKKDRSIFHSQESDTLFKAGYPRLATAVLGVAQKNVDTKEFPKWMDRNWTEASKASRKTDLSFVLTQIVLPEGVSPPGFGKDWSYFNGLRLEKTGALDDARKAFMNVDQNSWYYPKALFHRAVLAVNQDNFADARKDLRTALVRLDLRQGQSYPERVKVKLRSELWLNLARLYYDTSKFELSIQAYRNVERTTPFYSDALFEQSWALFMAGYPNHALGSLYSLSTPWYSARYKPEADMLESIIYFWLCDYNESRVSLAKFLTKHQSTIKGLDSFLSKKNTSSKDAWDIFENFTTGVSSESIGIDRNLLAEAIYQESLVPFREHLAGLFEEKKKLLSRGVNSSKMTDNVAKVLDAQIEIAKLNLGEQLIRELTVLHQDFIRLRDHAELLYVELLTSEKDKLLGKELYKDSKITDASAKRPSVWNLGVKQTWAATDKDEFWTDEIGFYVFKEKSMCSAVSKE